MSQPTCDEQALAISRWCLRCGETAQRSRTPGKRGRSMTQPTGVESMYPPPQRRSVPARVTHRRSTHPPAAYTGLTRALGWFSVGLGLTELLAPRALARAIGVK